LFRNVTLPDAAGGVTVAVKVTELLKVDVGLLDATVVVDPAAPTLKPLAASLVLKMPWSRYIAFKAWYTPTLGF
jgi:hypothetical protein